MTMASSTPLGAYTRNIGTMLIENATRLGEANVCAERLDGKYHYWTWKTLLDDVLCFAAFLADQEVHAGDRVGFVTSNSYRRLVTELAVMSSGAVSVPVFAGYPGEFVGMLLEYAKVKALVIENEKGFAAIPRTSTPRVVVKLNGVKLDGASHAGVYALNEILEARSFQKQTGEKIFNYFLKIPSKSMALVMFTSGTSGLPKGVQLSHANLMSQQRALELLWKPEPRMRFLCYLPWHHSFGGLFERFFALHSGGCIAIDDSLGKDINRLLKNFGEIRPHVFFSVPKVYQEIVSKILVNPELSLSFFHPELKYVFTAAAPLSGSIAEVFKARRIPVVEGWGLTETSPCCTLTKMSDERAPGVVGFPIPGVEVKLDDEKEILVRGPNVMSGYLDRPDETIKVMADGGWFRTGDLGEITERGLKIVSRKDRMFKLSNGEKVFPAQLEEAVKTKCKFVKHAYVWGRGDTQPLLMVVPNVELFSAEPGVQFGDEVCSHPRCARDLSACLGSCLNQLNERAPSGFERFKRAILVMREPTLENGEITPSFKLIPKAIEKNYQLYVDLLQGENYEGKARDDAMIINIKAVRSKSLHYGIIGMGPIGSVLAAHLHKAGLKVSAYCPFTEKFNLLKDAPIRVRGGLTAEARIGQVYADLGDFLGGKPDVILLATKSSDSPAVIEQICKHKLDHKVVFVSCQNGLDVEEQVSSVFGKNRALRLVLNLGCRQERENDVFVGFCYASFLSDIATHGPVSADFIAEDFNAGGFEVELKKDYRTEVFKKVILNSALSPVCAILGVTMRAAMEDIGSVGIVKQLVEESIKLAIAAGAKISHGFFDEAMEYLSKGGDHKPSMLLDIEQHRKTENDDHAGRLLRLADELGIKMPVTETIYRLMMALENRKKEYL
jgi:2-dehydropantoate 2-reductase